MPADRVLVAIGHSPASRLVAGRIRLKPSGYIEVAPHSIVTSVPAGDGADKTFRQAVTAAGVAALEVE